jgi:acetoin utilization deacetylase AcuC-like enzyme
MIRKRRDEHFASSRRRLNPASRSSTTTTSSQCASNTCRTPLRVLEDSIGIVLAVCAAVLLMDGVGFGTFGASHGVPPIPLVSALPLTSSTPLLRRGTSSAASSHRHYGRRRERYHRGNLAAPFLVSSSSCLLAASIPVYFDSNNHLHRDISYHPEQPERIAACVREIAAAFPPSSASGSTSAVVVELVDVAAEPSDRPSSYYLEQQKARLTASRDAADAQEPPPPQLSNLIRHRPFTDSELQHTRKMLVEAHSESLVSDLEKRCEVSKQQRVDDGKRDPLGHMGYLNGDPDCYVTTESFAVCLRAAAAWIRASRDARNDPSSSVGAAVALVRPPGHHATRTLQNGFCLFNFAAAAALSFLSENPDAKVFVLDWDVHYGQGTADILRGHPRARFASVHQAPAFPYEGEKLETTGEHKNILTIPISPSTTWST